MELPHKNEHLNCPYHDQSDKPLIEIMEIVRGDKNKLTTINNEIVFVVEGHIRYYSQDLPVHEGIKGQIIFRPAGSHYSYEAIDNSTVIIFRLNNPILLCLNFSIEKLYSKEEARSCSETDMKQIGTLEINSRIWHFLYGIMDCISDGVKCRYWFELKINEFFSYLRIYYPKEKIRDFFFLILSGDTAFSEHIRLNWHKFRTVQEMADSLNLTRNQFSKHFIKIFGQPPYRWIMENRAQKSYREIISTNKPFKYIAFENGFTDDTQFTRFCKIKFGKTPTELREGVTPILK